MKKQTPSQSPAASVFFLFPGWVLAHFRAIFLTFSVFFLCFYHFFISFSVQCNYLYSFFVSSSACGSAAVMLLYIAFRLALLCICLPCSFVLSLKSYPFRFSVLLPKILLSFYGLFFGEEQKDDRIKRGTLYRVICRPSRSPSFLYNIFMLKWFRM